MPAPEIWAQNCALSHPASSTPESSLRGSCRPGWGLASRTLHGLAQRQVKGACCLGRWLPADKDSWALWVLVAVRNGKVELGQIGTAFLRAFLLDPLNAPQVCKKPSTRVFHFERTVEKATQGGSWGIKGAGRTEDWGVCFLGLASPCTPSLPGAPLPALSCRFPG